MPAVIKSDLPTTSDTLGFTPYRDALASVIREAQTPLAIGIYGQWGSGKTSLMKMIKQTLDAYADERYCSIWFNAWKYDQEEALWRALLLHLIQEIRELENNSQHKKDEKTKNLKELDQFEQSLYRTVEWEEFVRWSMNWGKALAGTTEFAAEAAMPFIPGAKPLVELYKKIKQGISDEEKTSIADAFHKEVLTHRREQVLSVEQFEGQFRQIVEKHILPGRRLVVFVDDLDRCLPENIIKVFEAIKLFLDVEGCVFILGFDYGAIQEVLKQRFPDEKEQRGRLYLEKIIQLPFHLPPIGKAKMAEFLQALFSDLPEGCREIFSQGPRNNPREAKRVVNIFILLWHLAQSERELEGRITAGRLAKFVAIQDGFPRLYGLLCQTPRYLKDLEQYFQSSEAAPGEAEGSQPRKQLPDDLREFGGQAALRNILSARLPEEGFADLSVDDISAYVYLSYRTQAGQAEIFPFEPEMMRVRGGEFQMGLEAGQLDKIAALLSIQPESLKEETPRHKITVPGFEMARHPVTNREYAAFIEATGHPRPGDWENGDYAPELGDHPVVNVDWNDAMEYCRWLSQKTGRNYRLPLEAEWEYAARGTQERLFPWGNDWEAEKCNTRECHEGKTTRVGMFSPPGDSWCGCADMAGNVYEWTAEAYKPYPDGSDGQTAGPGAEFKVLRGGAWNFGAESARTTKRIPRRADSQEAWIGFRCVRVI